MSQINRKPGYYWVFLDDWLAPDGWVVAEWSGASWFLPGNELDFYDNDFKTIEETPIHH